MKKYLQLLALSLCLTYSNSILACSFGPTAKQRNLSFATSVIVAAFKSIEFVNIKDKSNRDKRYAKVALEIQETLYGEVSSNSFIYFNDANYSDIEKYDTDELYVIAVTTNSVAVKNSRWSISIGAEIENKNALWVIQEFCSLPFIRTYTPVTKKLTMEKIDAELSEREESK